MRENNRYANDFGLLPSPLLTDKKVTDVTELLWRDELQELLYLCGADERQIDSKASDYERFRALCQFFPMLQRHPIPQQCAVLLQKCFNILTPLNLENCDEIWKETTDALLFQPRTVWDCICQSMTNSKVRCLIDADFTLPEFLLNIEPVLNGNSLADLHSRSWEAWQKKMKDTLSFFEARGCSSVFMQISEPVCRIVPDVYHVDQALKGNEIGKEDKDLLSAQALRFLCAECKPRKLKLLLRVDCEGNEIVSCLERLERSVGLPQLVWFTANSTVRDMLLRFSAKPNRNRLIECALCTADHPSERELSFALDSFAARYPLARLQLICGTDLRGVAFERQRAEHCIRN